MAKSTKIEIEGIRNVYRMMDKLDRKTKGRVLSRVHRKPANKVKKALLAAAPESRNNTLRNPKNITISKGKTNLSAIVVGYNTNAFMARFFEKGTRERRTKLGYSRGRHPRRPFIERTHNIEGPKAIKEISKDYEKLVTSSLKSEARRTKRLLAKAGL